MSKQKLSIQDQDAQAFYGTDNAHFDRQINMIAGHDPRLVAAFKRTRAWYSAENEGADLHHQGRNN